MLPVVGAACQWLAPGPNRDFKLGLGLGGFSRPHCQAQADRSRRRLRRGRADSELRLRLSHRCTLTGSAHRDRHGTAASQALRLIHDNCHTVTLTVSVSVSVSLSLSRVQSAALSGCLRVSRRGAWPGLRLRPRLIVLTD
eukprot:63979-Rhodomonas_salina.1